MKKIFTLLLLVLLPFFLFSQVQLVGTDASKTYPDGTRITYFTVSDCPDDSDFLAYAANYVLKDDRMIRFKISDDGKSCFYEARKEVTEDMLVDLLNEAYYDFYSQTGVTPKSNSGKQSVSKSSISSKQNDSKDMVSNSVLANTVTRTFKKSDFNGIIYRVAFKLEDTPNLDNIKSATTLLKEKGNFEDIFINDNIHFELSSKEPISADFVIGIFEEFGLKIEEEFIK
ncbi:MAG: hypothetical protein RBR97_18905 [Bacteroidales bacterium]|nr:hypothetical protein [Bacteroidales bacterium]